MNKKKKNEKSSPKKEIMNKNNKKQNNEIFKDYIIKDKKYSEYEMNSLPYKKAIKIDKRTYWEYYYSLLKREQTIIFTFCTTNDYNSRSIKICLFLFSFALDYTVNALFYNDNRMHNIYNEEGKYNFVYQISNILYSTLISNIIILC